MTAKKCFALLLLAVCLVFNGGCKSAYTSQQQVAKYWCFEQLSDTQKEIYNKVLTAATTMQTGLVELGDYSHQDVQLVCRGVLSDRADLFWLPESFVVSKKDDGTICVGFECLKNNYLVLKDQKEDFQGRLNDTIAEINKGIKSDMSDFEKELYYHDWLCENVNYSQTVDDDLVYTAFGALVNKSAVCEGYARAMQLLCNTQGIDCHIVYGSAKNENGKYIGHMWNQIKIDGKYYNLDVTVDHTNGNYDYFNVTDKFIEQTHAFDRDYSLLTSVERQEGNASFNLGLPACTANIYNYYSVFPKEQNS